MCILFMHVNPDPKEGGYRLIIATNREEHYRRPALPAHRDEDTNIIGGKDMEPAKEGGMWLGFRTKGENGKSKKHCVAALLNLPGEVSDNGGRGFIVKDYLASSEEFAQYSKKIESNRYRGYNLVAIELSKDGAHTYHHGNIPAIYSIYSGEQTLAFGNSPTFSPFHKVTAGRRMFKKIVDKDIKGDELVEELMQLLKDRTRHLPDLELEDKAPGACEFLSSIFVDISRKGYGTRTHSIILVDYDWNVEFIEHTMKDPIDLTNPEWVVNKIHYKL